MTTTSPTVQSSTDYDKFQFMTGNRPINWNHVAKLKTEMEHDPEQFEYDPMLVNENLFIVDGQHRYLAAKDMNRPLYYTIRKGATITTARHKNTSQSTWTLSDFAASYAASGYKDYVEFQRVRDRIGNLPNGVVIMFMSGDTRDTTGKFRRGEFTINDNFDVADLEFLSEVARISGSKITSTMARAILGLLKNNDDFDQAKFLKKLEAAPQEFIIANNVRNCLRSIEDVYNWHSPTRVRLYS